MIASRNEIESLALKAARGAGMSWGLAEEASVAAGWLAEQQLPWAEALVCVLAYANTTSPPQVEAQRIAPSRPGTRLCPIMTGALLSDLGSPTSTIEICDLLAPLWLVPFLVWWAGPDRHVRVDWPGVALVVTRCGIAGTGAGAAAAPSTVAGRVVVALEPGDRLTESRTRREPYGYAVPDDAWRLLLEFEHRSYVPTSALSRIAGAGAGLSDND